MGIRLKVKNFRCLRNVDWSPDGVCVLVGPNGSGKTTLFQTLNFLRLAYELNVAQAAEISGGRFFCNLDASPEEGVLFVFEDGSCAWQLDIRGEPSYLGLAEQVTVGTEIILSKRPGEPTFAHRKAGRFWQAGPNDSGSTAVSALRFVTDLGLERLPIVSRLKSLTVYGEYTLSELRQRGSPVGSEMRLSPFGRNAFSVLRNWHDKSDYRPTYRFVVAQLRDAFPGIVDDLDFDFTAQITSIRLINKRRAESIPVHLAPNGWLVGLLHLMAVAGAEPGGVVMIDEFENSLHPFAIRRLVQSMREWAAKKQLTVVLAGHSPALLDEFRDHPARIFVMEPWRPGQPSMPLRLTDYRDPEWLKHFSLGELYRHEDFGGPNGTETNGAPAASAS